MTGERPTCLLTLGPNGLEGEPQDLEYLGVLRCGDCGKEHEAFRKPDGSLLRMSACPGRPPDLTQPRDSWDYLKEHVGTPRAGICDHCHQVRFVVFTPDPFESDVHDDGTELYLCAQCHDNSAQAI